MWYYSIKQNLKSLFSSNFSKSRYTLESTAPFMVTFSQPVERISYQYEQKEKRSLVPITVRNDKRRTSMFDVNGYFIIKATKVLVNKLIIENVEGQHNLILQEAFASAVQSGPTFQELSSTGSRGFKIISVEQEGWLLCIRARHEIYNRLDDAGITEIVIKIYLHRNTFINTLVFRAVYNEYKKIKKFIGC